MKNALANSEWAQVYQQAPDGQATVSSWTATEHQLNPKGGCISKQVRRRSRASKRIPTTLLNANAANFRALVQQFTGCPTKSISFGTLKGPVNLSFEQKHCSDSSLIAAYGSNQYHAESQLQDQEQPWYHEEQHQLSDMDQQLMFLYDNVTTDDSFWCSSSQSTSMENIASGFAVDDAHFLA